MPSYFPTTTRDQPHLFDSGSPELEWAPFRLELCFHHVCTTRQAFWRAQEKKVQPHIGSSRGRGRDTLPANLRRVRGGCSARRPRVYRVLQLGQLPKPCDNCPRYVNIACFYSATILIAWWCDVGSPRIWADRQMPMTVPTDSGKNFIDQNGHRMKKLTLLPLIRAVQDLTDQGLTEKFNWSSVDLVVDRGRLRLLLAWAVGSSDNWRIDTQLAGSNTVLLSGRAPVTKETSGRSNSHGFNYEEASTYPTTGLENGCGHHRIVAYVCAFRSGFKCTRP